MAFDRRDIGASFLGGIVFGVVLSFVSTPSIRARGEVDGSSPPWGIVVLFATSLVFGAAYPAVVARVSHLALTAEESAEAERNPFDNR